MATGGLEVKSPLIPQFAIRDHLCVDPAKKLQDALEVEKDPSTKLQEDQNSGSTTKPHTADHSLRLKPFLSYEEYALHREQRLTAPWEVVYEELLQVPEDETANSVAGPSITYRVRLIWRATTQFAVGICG